MNKLLKTLYNEYDISNIPNPYYQDIRLMSDDEINEMAETIRLALLKNWTDKKQPLGGGRKTDEQIINDFKRLTLLNIKEILTVDTEGKENILKYFGKLPSGLNQYFPEMLDTPIALGKKAISVLDVIKGKEVFNKFFRSIVINDRMYSFTNWAHKHGKENVPDCVPDHILELLGDKIPNPYTTGYKIPFYFEKNGQYYKLIKIDDNTPVRYDSCTEKEYQSMRLFPQITQSFRLGGGSQPVSNFNAGIARYIILTGFHHSLDNNLIENDFFVVLDPSTGWGGRLLGLLSCYTEMRKIYQEKTGKSLRVVYLTTDPNLSITDRYKIIKDDWFDVIEPDSNRKDFYLLNDVNGSETPEFYNFCKARIDKMGISGVNMGLTSPPYFNREMYSTDPGQSCVKYGSSYESWSHGFLKPTIENISKLLRTDGIFYMNIANINSGSKALPLEGDTVKYGEECGLECKEILKMLMATMTGNNKTSKGTGGNPTNGVTIKIKGITKTQKFEPIFLMRKKN